MTTDTIAAICSGLSVSGISVIRISGSDSFSVADRIFKSASKKTVFELRSNSVNYGHIVDLSGNVIDEVLLLKMVSPHTYTREDVIEIDCHGGIVVTRRVLDTVFSAGARPAEPGEFTKRAFLNGRIDLSQAESVMDIIHSKSDLALANSINQLRGTVKEKIHELREGLLKNTAFIEAALDDPEHISLDGFSENLLSSVTSARVELNKMIKSFDDGRLIKEGINTVILGRPNAGKSSLLNLLLDEERAIVTDIAGTTRDTLEESVVLDDVLLNLIDTAGIRDTDDAIEKIGVDKALSAAKRSDLILYVVDSSIGLSDVDRDILNSLSDKKLIVILNKSDICKNIDSNIVRRSAGLLNDVPIIEASMTEAIGLDLLRNTIKNMFYSGSLQINDEIYITNARQKNLLVEALHSLDSVIMSIENDMPEDFYSIDLMGAYTSLGLITGDNVEDDLADKIFSDFCMGK